MSNAKKLRQLIARALTCQGHFIKPTVIQNDPIFNMGNSRVICEVCVRALLDGLKGTIEGQRADVLAVYEQYNR